MTLGPAFWEGGLTGAVTGLIAAGTAVATRRHGRLAKLEEEVAACKHRDAEFVVIKAGFRLVVGALARREPTSPELRICRDLLERHLPMTAADRDINSFEDLLEQLDTATTEEPPRSHS